uniref:Uncharacterized protein n=1 Tax=Nephromyces sp. ex Molgula occidentalis TaxID=2544991 RepID=A0A5C1H7Q3_9APIC|nr:hypothetical protein [Nephromyces sp. ex Molgula occidentalis]
MTTKLNKKIFFNLKSNFYKFRFYNFNLINLKYNTLWKFNLLIYENKKFKIKSIIGILIVFKNKFNQIFIKNEINFIISLNSPQIKNFHNLL